MLPTTPKFNQMVALIKKYHSHQTRSPSNIPYWHHLVSVAEILCRALSTTHEITPDQPLFNDSLLATLGHDLYEDTEVEPSMIEKEFGTTVHNFITQMTNQQGD